DLEGTLGRRSTATSSLSGGGAAVVARTLPRQGSGIASASFVALRAPAPDNARRRAAPSRRRPPLTRWRPPGGGGLRGAHGPAGGSHDTPPQSRWVRSSGP